MKEILITSSVLILALLILRLTFAKRVRRTLIYGAWALVALRLLIPVQIGQLDFSVLTAAKPVTEAITQVTDKQVAGVTEQDAYREIIKDYVEKDQTVFAPQVQEHIQSAIKDDMPKEEIAVMIDKVYAEQEIFVPEVQEQVQRQVEETADPITLGQIAIAVWLAGVGVMAIWFAIVNLRHSRKLRQNREKLDCKSPIPVYVSDKVGSPCLVGLFHPVIYLTPESATPERLRHVLTHELTHYAHKDHIWSLVRCVCLCVYWFHPLVWVAAWFSRRDCELACDEGAMARLGEGERIAYGKTLLDVVSHAAAHAHLLQTATAMNETKKQLKERVNFIVKKPKLSIIAAICMVLVCAIVAGCVAAGPMGEPPVVNEELIKEDAVEQFSTLRDTCKPEEVKLTIISQFGDTYALFVDLPFLMYTQALWTDTVNGLKFNYFDGQRMYIYADREFHTFRVAFDEKIITADQLTTIWEDYYEKYPNRKNMFEEPTLGTTQPTEPTQPTAPTQPTRPFDPNDMTYTVRVVDEQGNPVQGVTVELFFPITMGRRITDNNGIAKWEHMQWDEDAVACIVERAGRLEGYIYHGVTFEPDGVFEQTIVAKKQVMRTYRIRFVDEDGLPLENLCVSLNYEKTYTDADGYAQWEIPEKYGYSVRLENMPEWYVTKYDIPYDTWELTIVVIKMHDYTVRVVDTQGNPIPNVGCTLVGEREDRLRTDENGCVTWKKFRGNYLFGCSIDVGHDVVGARQYFPEGQTEMTIVLDLTSRVYPMQVVDGAGQPLKGSYIQIKTGNEVIAWDVTDENGMIYWELASAPVYVEYCTEYDIFGGDFIRLEAVRYAWPEGETAMTLVWENKLVTYQIRLVDANGAPATDVHVRIHPEGGMDSDYRVGTADGHAGVISFRDLERDYTVRIYYGNEMLLYGTFEFAADETEVTIVVEIPEE